MKRFLSMLNLVVLGFAFTSCYDDSALWDSVKELEGKVKSLETLCNETNANLASLQALITSIKQGDYIVDVTPLIENGKEVGYQITFHERGVVNIYHGKDGINASDLPEFGAKQDTDGNYYWTVNGEWVTDDNGNKIPVVAASGVSPMLKVEDGRWYASYDEGKTWKDVGSAVSEGGSGCIFKDVEFADGNLTLTMSDGNVFVIPVGERFSIVLGDYDASSIQYGAEVVVPYTITGTNGEVAVFAVADGWIFSTEIKEETPLTGKLTIRQEDYDDEEVNGRVALFAVAEDGTTVSKVIRLSSGVLFPTENYYDNYTVSADAGKLEVTVSTNRTLEVKTNADWITYADTKTVEEKTLVFDIQENDGARRKTDIEIASGKIDFSFTVVQKGFSDAFFIDVACDEIQGGNWFFNVDTLYNKAGQKIYEALGYSSWDEVAMAAGDYETVYERKGEVLLLAYDLHTGEALPYDEKYRHGVGFAHDADGNLAVINDYNQKTYWSWNRQWIDDASYLSQEFYVSVNHRYPGNTYSFGILLTSPEGEVRIEVTIRIEEYIDPEKGLYDNPAAPGTYEFTICDTLDVDNARLQFLFNNSIAEDIKSTLGMTSYEIYKKYQEYSINTEFEFKDCYADGRDGGKGVDINGCRVDWGNPSSVANVGWDLGPINISVTMGFNIAAWGNPIIFTQQIYDALGKTVSYKYIITYNDYKLIFTHNISYVGDANGVPSGNSLLVKSEDMVSNPLDTQFFLTFGQELKEGDLFEVSMWVKSDNSAAISTQIHAAPGNYLHWNAIGTVNFGYSWKKHTYSGYVSAEMAGGKSIAFFLNDYQYANRYYFDNISVKINGVEQIINGDCEDPAQNDSYLVINPSYQMCPPAYVDSYGEIVAGVCMVMSNDNLMDDIWNVQVIYNLSEPMKAGARYELKCVAKATSDYPWCRVFLAKDDGQDYRYGMSFYKEWQEVTLVLEPENDYNAIIFNIGDFVGQLYIDKLSLKEIGSDVELVSNGDFEEDNTYGWYGWGSSTPYYLSENGEGYTGSVSWM